ncbi:MAG: tRNA 2-thiocytidine biosynthesis TtcA family protein [Bacillota bacterium]
MKPDPARGLYPLLGRALSDYRMIDTAEPVLLGISGGKDSLMMAYLLNEMRNRSPVKFTLVGLTVDPGGESGFTDAELETVRLFLEGMGIPYRVVRTKINSIIQGHPQESACSLCANLRRGAIYKTANEMGIRRVALAHHLDDAIETLFLNMFYQSSLRCFDPKTYLSRRDVTAIRPLVYIPEKDIVRVSQRLGLPVIKTRCPVAGTTRRQEMKAVVSDLSAKIPAFRNHLRSVLKQVWALQRAGDEQCDPEQ